MINEMVNSVPKIMRNPERRNLERFKSKERIKKFYDKWKITQRLNK